MKLLNDFFGKNAKNFRNFDKICHILAILLKKRDFLKITHVRFLLQ